MAPDIYTFEPDSAVHSIHRDRIGELRERLIRLQQESDRITRSFVRLHGLRTAIATPGADLVERVEQGVGAEDIRLVTRDHLLDALDQIRAGRRDRGAQPVQPDEAASDPVAFLL